MESLPIKESMFFSSHQPPLMAYILHSDISVDKTRILLTFERFITKFDGTSEIQSFTQFISITDPLLKQILKNKYDLFNTRFNLQIKILEKSTLNNKIKHF